MNRRLPKLWQQAAVTLLAVIFSALIPLSTVYADEFPYFRTSNGGPFVGGWFEPSCEGSYQSPTFPSSSTVADEYNGAIMAWAGSNRGQSAGSSLDAFATGLIEGDGGPDYGFYTGLNGTSALSFANVENFTNIDNPPFWGGIFEGADLGPNHCIPDYQSSRDSPTNWTGFNVNDGQYVMGGGGSLTGTVPAGRQIILFADNDVRITNNIQYQGGYNMDDVTKFVLVVRGNIYIAPNVTRMDGWYVAQPSNATNGVIWTCSDGSMSAADIRTQCVSPLVINGAFTAKQVNLARINGNIDGDPAEIVNFTPEMILGGPFFEGDTPSTTGAIQSLISLPPVF